MIVKSGNNALKRTPPILLCTGYCHMEMNEYMCIICYSLCYSCEVYHSVYMYVFSLCKCKPDQCVACQFSLVTSIIMSVSAYALLFIHGILVFGQSVNGQMQNELACVRFESGKLYVCLIQL